MREGGREMSHTCTVHILYHRNYGPTIRVQQFAESKGCNQVLWLYGDDQQV